MVEWFAGNWGWFLGIMLGGIPLGFLMLGVAYVIKEGKDTVANVLGLLFFGIGAITCFIAVGICKLLLIVSIIMNIVIYCKG